MVEEAAKFGGSMLYTILAVVFALLSALSLSKMHLAFAIVMAAAWLMFRRALDHQSQPPLDRR